MKWQAVKLLILPCVAVFFSSCYSYKVLPKEYRKIENTEAKIKAYILNDTLEKERKILEYSELYEFVSDSTQAEANIKLQPLEQSYSCGNPILGTMITLGQVPAVLPDRFMFRFDVFNNDTIAKHELSITVAKRIWFWDLFTFNRNFEKKAGKALLGTYIDKQIKNK